MTVYSFVLDYLEGKKTLAWNQQAIYCFLQQFHMSTRPSDREFDYWIENDENMSRIEDALKKYPGLASSSSVCCYYFFLITVYILCNTNFLASSSCGCSAKQQRIAEAFAILRRSNRRRKLLSQREMVRITRLFSVEALLFIQLLRRIERNVWKYCQPMELKQMQKTLYVTVIMKLCHANNMIRAFRMQRPLFIFLLRRIVKNVWKYYYPMELK